MADRVRPGRGRRRRRVREGNFRMVSDERERGGSMKLFSAQGALLPLITPTGVGAAIPGHALASARAGLSSAKASPLSPGAFGWIVAFVHWFPAEDDIAIAEFCGVEPRLVRRLRMTKEANN